MARTRILGSLWLLTALTWGGSQLLLSSQLPAGYHGMDPRQSGAFSVDRFSWRACGVGVRPGMGRLLPSIGHEITLLSLRGGKSDAVHMESGAGSDEEGDGGGEEGIEGSSDLMQRASVRQSQRGPMDFGALPRANDFDKGVDAISALMNGDLDPEQEREPHPEPVSHLPHSRRRLLCRTGRQPPRFC